MSAGDAPRIAMVGGGIGGLAAAAFLHRRGLPATVYEQASRLAEVGAGLVVTPNAARLLRRLGVLEDVRRHAVQLQVAWEFRRWADGTVLSAENLAGACEQLYGEHTYTVHRADLLSVLQSQLPQECIRLGHRCTGLRESGGAVRLEFAGGQAEQADVVIGAAGIHSAVREALFGASPAAYSGLCAFRALVRAPQAPDFARRPAHTIWIGPGRHLVHYPVSAGEQVNLVAITAAGDYTTESWTATAAVAELLAEFGGWDPRLTALVRAAGTPGRWALLDRAPLPRWSDGGVTLLGDAAHPMFPFFAQGAAQAIEDAAVLARCLADGIGDPVVALRRYEQLRIPRTARLQEASHGRAEVNHLPDGPDQQQRDAAFAGQDPLATSGWIYGYDADDA